MDWSRSNQLVFPVFIHTNPTDMIKSPVDRGQDVLGVILAKLNCRRSRQSVGDLDADDGFTTINANPVTPVLVIMVNF